VELKAHYCEVESIRKDLEKLIREDISGIWFHTLEKGNAGRVESLFATFRAAFELLSGHLNKSERSYLIAICLLDHGLVLPNSEKNEVLAGYQFNFTVRNRVAREDGDEHLFDFHTVVVRSDNTVDEGLAELAANSYSADRSSDQSTLGALKELESIGVHTAFESARTYLEKRTKIWDWDEEVDLVGAARVVFVPANS
jgi:hypothetical protein